MSKELELTPEDADLLFEHRDRINDLIEVTFRAAKNNDDDGFAEGLAHLSVLCFVLGKESIK